MYFPYLRGRQNELLALRELVENDLIGEHILPVLEPVKMNSTLNLTLKVFIEKRKKIAIIVNPTVGALNERLLNKKEDMEFSEIAKEFFELIKDDSIIISYILNDKSAEILDNDSNKDNYLIVNSSIDTIYTYDSIFGEVKPLYTLIPNSSRFKKIVKGKKIIFEDKFDKKSRNADYKNNVDNCFSDANLCYKVDGYEGFSDYSIVGSEFIESGFAPTAVAIHLIYLDDNYELRIHHCVSDSNIGIEDPAGKFEEALKKLIEFCDNKKIKHTRGLDGFYKCFNEQTYPGLGVIKKFSIMHHIELVSDYLEERK